MLSCLQMAPFTGMQVRSGHVQAVLTCHAASQGFTGAPSGAGENIREWRSLRSLQELNLKGCYKIEDGGLQGLSLMTSLTSLNLQECWQITEGGLAAISGSTLVVH